MNWSCPEMKRWSWYCPDSNSGVIHCWGPVCDTVKDTSMKHFMWSIRGFTELSSHEVICIAEQKNFPSQPLRILTLFQISWFGCQMKVWVLYRVRLWSLPWISQVFGGNYPCDFLVDVIVIIFYLFILLFCWGGFYLDDWWACFVRGSCFLLNVLPCFDTTFMSWELMPVAEFTYSKSSPRESELIRDLVKSRRGHWNTDSTCCFYAWSASENQWMRIRMQPSPARAGRPPFGSSRHMGNKHRTCVKNTKKHNQLPDCRCKAH